MEIQGEFNVQKFYETLAKIISQKEKVDITVKVIQRPKEQQEVEQIREAS